MGEAVLNVRDGMQCAVGVRKASRKVATSLVAAAVACVCPTIAIAGPSIGQFEMKQVETEAGDIEFQSQNAYSWGQPQRHFRQTGPDEFIFDDNSVVQARNALELEVSWTNWLRTRVGIEFEKERFDDPETLGQADAFNSLKFDGYAAETVVVLVPIKGNGFGLAWLTEFEKPVENLEAMTLIIGPLIEAKRGPWRLLLNLAVTRFLGGELEELGVSRDNKWDFNYAAQVKYDFSNGLELALEAYGTVDRIGNTGTRSEEVLIFGDHDLHRLGPILYYTTKLGHGSVGNQKDVNGGGGNDDSDDEDNIPTATFGVGPLIGLNNNTPDLTLKLSLEIDF